MPTILLVDDSPVARRVLARRLATEGFVVHEESSANAAREADANVLACAIIDLELYDGDGSELAARLRRKRPSLPIAFFTAGASSAILAQALAHGPVFMKPDVDAIVDWAKAAGQPPPTK